MRIILTLLFCILSLEAYSKDLIASCGNGLSIELSVKEKVTTFSFFDNFQFNNKLPIVFGHINIINNSKEDQYFSTKMLNLNFNNTHYTRAYKMTIASEAIDISKVKISPSAKLSVKVYWAPKLNIGDKITTIESNCVKST